MSTDRGEVPVRSKGRFLSGLRGGSCQVQGEVLVRSKGRFLSGRQSDL